MKLKGKAGIITGAGSGIGKAIAELFAEQGAAVLVVDWNRDAGERVVHQIQQSHGNAIYCFGDVSKSDDIRNMVACAKQHFSTIDFLVNNAAIQILGTLAETEEEDWDRIHNVNLRAVFLGCKYVIPLMVTNGGGVIINMGSILGFVADPELAAYCAAKGGVIALTKAAALAYGPYGIRLNCICPGDVETPLLEEYFTKDPDPAKLRQEVSAKYALRRIARPHEIAQLAAFLVSDESSFITGAAMVIDGGLTVKCY